MNVGASAPFEASYGSGIAGAVGTVEVAVVDNDGNIVIGPTATNITEETIGASPTGIYTWNAPAAPATLGQYIIAWSIDGTWDPISTSTPDELNVVEAGAVGVLPPIPAPVDGGPAFGPGTAWTTGEAVAACCSAEVGTDYEEFDPFIDEASQVLFELSGRLFVGLMQKTAYPPCRDDCWCGQVLSRGHVIGSLGGDGPCHPSRVLLSGYPVREITQVKINGDVLANTEYRLDNYRWAVRLNNGRWPQHNNHSQDDTEDGTWSITYTYGQNPPLAGQSAAAQLACELWKSCNAGAGDCALPQGTTRIVRQGVTIERLAFSAWGRQLGIWRTGLTLVDEFLNAYNPGRLTRRPVVWSPALTYARKVV